MEKTESKTGGIAKFQEMSKDWENNPKILRKIIKNLSEKIDELQAKAEAYDRLMSGEPKHCPFCHGEIKPIDHPPFWMAINGSQIDVYVDGLGAMATTINYCPMCGRRLTMPDGWEER